MKDLVVLKGKEVFTDSWIIAEGTGNEHRAVRRLIEKYENDIKDFGKVCILNAPLDTKGGTQEVTYYQLNEEQAAFLMTLLRNSSIVVQFKKELVRQFYVMRRLLQEQQSDEWRYFRKEGKAVRKAETEVIKELAQYAKARGSKNYGRLYNNYTALANKTVGIKHVNDATTMQLNYLKLIEKIFEQIILVGMTANKDHHDIYRDCKAKAAQLSSVVAIG